MLFPCLLPLSFPNHPYKCGCSYRELSLSVKSPGTPLVAVTCLPAAAAAAAAAASRLPGSSARGGEENVTRCRRRRRRGAGRRRRAAPPRSPAAAARELPCRPFVCLIPLRAPKSSAIRSKMPGDGPKGLQPRVPWHFRLLPVS